MKRACALLASLAAPLLAGAGAPPTKAELTEIADQTRCEQPAPGHVIYAGDSAELAFCLDKVKGGEIRELRITSRGGEATGTLKLAERYRGHLDRVIVEGLCASSCANYILPAAKRVRVAEHAYVLLHGSINVHDFEAQRAQIFANIRRQVPASVTDDEVQRMIDGERDKLAADVPAQEAFAKQTLKCGDWLDPKAHANGTPPADSSFLLVTPAMAQRCLKTARIESWWAPEAQDQFAPELGFFRALR